MDNRRTTVNNDWRLTESHRRLLPDIPLHSLPECPVRPPAHHSGTLPAPVHRLFHPDQEVRSSLRNPKKPGKQEFCSSDRSLGFRMSICPVPFLVRIFRQLFHQPKLVNSRLSASQDQCHGQDKPQTQQSQSRPSSGQFQGTTSEKKARQAVLRPFSRHQHESARTDSTHSANCTRSTVHVQLHTFSCTVPTVQCQLHSFARTCASSITRHMQQSPADLISSGLRPGRDRSPPRFATCHSSRLATVRDLSQRLLPVDSTAAAVIRCHHCSLRRFEPGNCSSRLRHTAQIICQG